MSFYIGQKVVCLINSIDEKMERNLVKGNVEIIKDLHFCNGELLINVGIKVLVKNGEYSQCRDCTMKVSEVYHYDYCFSPLQERKETVHNKCTISITLPQPVEEVIEVIEVVDEPICFNLYSE